MEVWGFEYWVAAEILLWRFVWLPAGKDLASFAFPVFCTGAERPSYKKCSSQSQWEEYFSKEDVISI